MTLGSRPLVCVLWSLCYHSSKLWNWILRCHHGDGSGVVPLGSRSAKWTCLPTCNSFSASLNVPFWSELFVGLILHSDNQPDRIWGIAAVKAGTFCSQMMQVGCGWEGNFPNPESHPSFPLHRPCSQCWGLAGSLQGVHCLCTYLIICKYSFGRWLYLSCFHELWKNLSKCEFTVFGRFFFFCISEQSLNLNPVDLS